MKENFASKKFRSVLIFALILAGGLGCFARPIYAQKNPLDFFQILQGLLTKGNTPETASFESRTKYIIETIRYRGVNFRMTPYRENFLRNTGASEQLITSIQQARLVTKTLAAGSAEYYFRQAGDCSDSDSKCRLDNYTKAIQINPKYLTAYSNRGLLYKGLGLKPLALADYNKAIELAPNFALVYINRGALYIAEKDFTLAVSDFNQALAINPRFATAYYNRGFARFNLGNIRQALADYNQAIEINPKYIDAYIERRQVYLKLGENEKAQADFQTAETLKSLLGEN